MTNERENLITKRTEAGMTQRELAERMDVSQSYVARFESGSKAWPLERVEQALEEIAFYATEHTEDEREAYLEQMRAILDRFNAEGWPEE